LLFTKRELKKNKIDVAALFAGDQPEARGS